MGVLDEMMTEERSLHIRRPDDPKPASVTVFEKKQVNLEPFHNGFTFEEAYETRLVASTTWYANKAQHANRRELARRELIELIYRPVIERLTRIEARAMDRDWVGVIEQVSAIRDQLKP